MSTVSARKLTIALGISAALNLFLLGVLSVRLLHPWQAAGREHGGPPGGAAFLGGHKKEMLDHRKSAREARRQVKAALEAESFDQAILEQRLAALRAETARSQETLHRALVERAVAATPEERRELSRNAELAHPGRHRGPGHWERPRN